MLGIGLVEIFCVALFGGILGGRSMALLYKHTHKFNIKMMEQHWRTDIDFLKNLIEKQNQKISTLSVVNPVNNTAKSSPDKGYKHSRNC